MTRDDIIRMAHEAGDLFVTQFGVASATPEWLERFFRAAYAAGAAAEREACAQIADAEASIEGIAQRISVAIRARGNVGAAAEIGRQMT